MSKPFTLTPSIEKQTGSSILIFFAIDPKPEKDDKMDFSTIIESPYFNPVFSDEILENRAQVIIDGVKYHCCDGVICSTRTKDMKVQYRFPASIKMDPNDFVPFVGSYTGKIDYIVESEIKRMLVRTDSFGGNVIIELSIESPLLRHVYGIAWNPPKNPNKISV
jgi:hypothetical protein